MNVNIEGTRRRMSDARFGVSLNLKPPITQVALASKRVYRRGVVVSNLFLFGIVAYAHADVVVACPTINVHLYKVSGHNQDMHAPPDVERQFKAGNKNPSIELTSSVS